MTNLSSICKHTPFTNHVRENTVAVSNAALNLSPKYNFHINSPEHCENNLYAQNKLYAYKDLYFVLKGNLSPGTESGPYTVCSVRQ